MHWLRLKKHEKKERMNITESFESSSADIGNSAIVFYITILRARYIVYYIYIYVYIPKSKNPKQPSMCVCRNNDHKETREHSLILMIAPGADVGIYINDDEFLRGYVENPARVIYRYILTDFHRAIFHGSREKKGL